MSQTESDFNALLSSQTAKEPPAAPTVAPTLADSYMAHTDTMRAGAANDEFNALLRGQQSAQPQTPQAVAKPEPSTLQKVAGTAEAVGADVGKGIIESPLGALHGVRNAYQSIIDLAKDAGDFTNKYLPALQVTGAGAPRFVSAKERAENPELPPSLADDIHFPNWGEPTSTTGKVVENIAQFVTGMSVAGSQLKAVGLPAEAAGMAGRGITALKGAMSMFEAFDGPQKNLSNIIQSVPALQNPVNEFLAAKGDDSDITKRLKSAAEGTIAGQVFDAFIGGLRFLRGVNEAKTAADAAAGLAEGNVDLDTELGPAKSGLAELGDANAAPEAPLVSANIRQAGSRVAAQEEGAAAVTPEQAVEMGKPAPEGEVAGPASPGATEAQAKEPELYVNFARIDSPDDIKRAMSQMADTFKGDIDGARRGVQTFEDTKLGADAVNAWDTLMSRRVGEPLNAEESLAARQLWATSAAKTQDLAQMAVSDPTPENLFAFRKMLATHAAIQEQVIAARTETARALSSWRIPAGSADYRMAGVLSALKGDTGDAAQGLAVSLNLAQRVKALQEAGDVSHLGDFIEKGVYATSRDAALEAWTNGLLTGPLTHVKVTVSNAATVAQRITERAVASRVDEAIGNTNGVAAGEASAQYAGLVSGLKDAFRFAGRAANAVLNEEPLPPLGDDPLSNAIKAGRTGVYSAGETSEFSSPGAISSQAFNISQSGWLGQGVDLLGQVIRSPGKALTAEHDFFRSIGYRMELNALATRQATQEAANGQITSDALGSRIAEIVANPPPSVTIGSIDAMKYQSFTDAPGKMAQWLEQGLHNWPEARFILPFYKIPSRILSYTFERTPLAPLMSTYQANIAAGGARASLARAQMGLGTAVMLATADAVMSGSITGSGPPSKATRGAMQNTGWLPYSMKVGDHWVQYNRVETAGSSMAMAADIVETCRNYNTAMNADDADISKLGIAAALTIAQDVTSKTYLQGLSNLFETLANPKTEGEARFRSFAGSAVPAGVAAVDRIQDPNQRAVYSMMDAIKSRTPGASESLPPRRNTWGEPISHASGMGNAYDLFSPFATRQPTDSPIDKEIVRLGANVNLPEAKTNFSGVNVNLQNDPKMYSRYVELAGNGYKDPAYGGLGAKDLLNQVVSGNHWLSPIYNMKNDDPAAGVNSKADMIRSIMNQYRDGAKRQMLKEFPELQSQVTEKTQQRQALRMPSL